MKIRVFTLSSLLAVVFTTTLVRTQSGGATTSRLENRPPTTTRGQLMDHIAVSVTDLDAWVAKLKSEEVTFLEQAYKFGDTRAAMIEGPSREALELVEKK